MYSIHDLLKEEAPYVRRFANGRKNDRALIREIAKFYCHIKDYNKDHQTNDSLFTIDTNFCSSYIQRLQVVRRGTGLIELAKQGTKQCVYFQLHSFYAWLMLQEDVPNITLNPFTYVDRPVKGRQPDLSRIYPDHKLRDLFSKIRENCDPETHQRDYLIAYLIYITGKKPSQVCGIRLNQIVIDEHDQAGIQFNEKGLIDTALIPEDLFTKLLNLISSYGMG